MSDYYDMIDESMEHIDRIIMTLCRSRSLFKIQEQLDQRYYYAESFYQFELTVLDLCQELI